MDERNELMNQPCNVEQAESQGNRIRPIKIEEVSHGYIVRVRCSTFAISTKEELIEKLMAYIKNPTETEQKWGNGQLF